MGLDKSLELRVIPGELLGAQGGEIFLSSHTAEIFLEPLPVPSHLLLLKVHIPEEELHVI
jgi:hypothetical protein